MIDNFEGRLVQVKIDKNGVWSAAPAGVRHQLSLFNVYICQFKLLNYNVCCYAGTYETHTNRLLLLQKRAVRLINDAPFLSHTDPLFFSSGLLKIHDIYKLNVGLYMFDHWHEDRYNRTHSYDTRNRNDLLPNRPRMTITQNSLSVAGPRIWNRIPLETRNRVERF